MTENKIINGVIPTTVKILNWNLWWRFGPWEQRQPAILKTLQKLDADVITLQEIWADDQTNQAKILASELGYHHVFTKAMTMNGVGFGNAILSRWPIANTKSKELPGHEESHEPRCVSMAEIDGPRGPLMVFNTHLNFRYEHSHIRQQQVAAIAAFVKQHAIKSYPPVLCGDFNAVPDSDEIRMLKGLTSCPVPELFFHDAWEVAGDGSIGHTWDNQNTHAAELFEPNRRIDYIFAAAPVRRTAGHIKGCRIVADQPVDGVFPSDHFAVLAELRY